MRALLIANEILSTSARQAKAVAKKRYVPPSKRGGAPRRTGKMLGAWVLDGEPVRKGDKIWDESGSYGGPWQCIPGLILFSQIL